jgi:CIC family chloride channel protein
MVGELTGNYELLLPSMLVVCFSMVLVHRWTIYTEQVPTRADSPAHRNELVRDVLADLPVGAVVDPEVHLASVEASVSLRDAIKLADRHHQRSVPVIDRAGTFLGLLSVDVMRSVLAEDPARGLVIAQDLIDPDVPPLSSDVPIPRALELLAAANVDALAVTTAAGGLLGVLDRRAILGAYRRKLDEASGTIPAPTSIDT